MFTFSIRNLCLFALVSIAWYYGAISLYESLTNFSSEWYWVVLATLYAGLVVDVFCHHIVGHNAFNINVKSWLYKLFAFLSTTIVTMGRLQKMALTHWPHHAFPDRPYYDTVDIRRMGLTVSSFSPLMFIYSVKMQSSPKHKKQIARLEKQFSDMLADPWTRFCDDYTVPLTIITWLVLYYVCPVFLFKVLFMGRVLISLHSIISGLGHVKLPLSYKNFNKGDSTYNNLIFHYLGLGIGSSLHLQNNHHNMDIKNTHSYRWFEVDVGSFIMRTFIRPLMEKK